MTKLKREDFLDTRGHFRTTSLFRETIEDSAKKAGYSPVMTLREFEVDGLPSMHNMFIEDRDVTGYTTCMRTVGVWRYWKRLWANKVLKAHMDAWIEELEVMLAAEGLQKMRGNDSPAAAKYLMEKGWDKKAGRPSKQQVENEAKRQAQVDNDLKDDAERIRLVS